MVVKKTTQKKKTGRPKGRKDSKPRKKRKKKTRKVATQPKPQPTEAAGASAKPEQTGATVNAELGGSETVPYPTAGENPAFADFLSTELGGAGGGAGDPAAQGSAPPAAGSGLTPEWFADAYKFLGRKWAEALRDKSMEFQPYEIKALVPPSVTCAQKYLGSVNPYDVCIYELCVVATVVFGPRLTRTANVAMERFTRRKPKSGQPDAKANRQERDKAGPSDGQADDGYTPQEL